LHDLGAPLTELLSAKTMTSDAYQVDFHQWNTLPVSDSSFECQIQAICESLDAPSKRSFETFLEQNSHMVQSMGAVFDDATACQLKPMKKRRLGSFRLTESLIHDRRLNKKPPAGNNIYGRKGGLGCEACRKRKRQVHRDVMKLANPLG